MNSVLSIQDTDWGKSLLRFADEAPVTPEAIGWLEYQVGNTYGLDKEPIHVRKNSLRTIMSSSQQSPKTQRAQSTCGRALILLSVLWLPVLSIGIFAFAEIVIRRDYQLPPTPRVQDFKSSAVVVPMPTLLTRSM